MKLSREWAMPSSATFSIAPIADLVRRYCRRADVIVDPFSGGSAFGTVTNDLNPGIAAQFHLDAIEFCDQLLTAKIPADVVLFDPPYSPRQVMECYAKIGRRMTRVDGQNSRMYRETKDRLALMLKPGGIAISCGWNSVGFGTGRGFEQIEILLVSHGAAHNDTIITVERKSLTGAPAAAGRRCGL